MSENAQNQSSSQPDNHAARQAELEQVFSSPVINPEAQGTKPESTESTEKKEEKKTSIIDFVVGIPSAIYESVLKPIYDSVSGGSTRVWGWIKDTYNHEVALFKEMKALRYLLERGGSLLTKGLKYVAMATAAMLAAQLMFKLTGINVFDPMTLAIVFIGAIVAFGIKSYLDQKDAGVDFSLKTMGQNIVDSIQKA